MASVKETTPSYKNEASMRRLYVEEDLSIVEVANQCNCSPDTVSRWLRNHGIEVYKQPEYPTLSDESSLRELYIDKQLTTVDIAERVGASNVAVSNWLDRHGIESRPPGYIIDEKLRDESYLRQEYIKRKRTVADIASELDCSPDTVRKRLDEYDIPRRDARFKPGREHFNWDGGRDLYRGKNWPQARRRALERDDHTCRVCGMRNDEHKERFTYEINVHHKIPLKEFDDVENANRLSNLVTLCVPCHKKAEKMAPLVPTNAYS